MNGDLATRGAVAGAIAAAAGVALGAIGANLAGGGSAWTLIVIAALAAGLGIGWVALHRSARDIRAVRAAADRLAEGELGERVVGTSGPVGELTHTFNTMAGRVQSLFESIAAEHARLEAVFDASSEAMVAVSREGIVRFLNPAAVEIFSTTMTRAVGRPFIEMARDYELDALVRRAITTPGASEAAVITFGAARRPLRAAAERIVDGGDWAVLLMLTDLTEVQRVDQVRRDFLSNVSHELRTPLASISALVETLEGEASDDGIDTEFLRRIRQQVDRLTTLVNELLDLSRIESGAVELRPEEVNLAELCREAASLLAPRAEAQEIAIACPHESELSVFADRPSLLRVVSNLLDNAIKYSPRKSTIRAAISDERELVALSVSDEGAGIPARDLPRVFERFYKGEASRSSAGVGLGLAIVKHLVRAHGGTVEVTSTPGEGATFTVRLPKVFVGTGRARGAGR